MLSFSFFDVHAKSVSLPTSRCGLPPDCRGKHPKTIRIGNVGQIVEMRHLTHLPELRVEASEQADQLVDEFDGRLRASINAAHHFQLESDNTLQA